MRAAGSGRGLGRRLWRFHAVHHSSALLGDCIPVPARLVPQLVYPFPRGRAS